MKDVSNELFELGISIIISNLVPLGLYLRNDLKQLAGDSVLQFIIPKNIKKVSHYFILDWFCLSMCWNY